MRKLTAGCRHLSTRRSKAPRATRMSTEVFGSGSR